MGSGQVAILCAASRGTRIGSCITLPASAPDLQNEAVWNDRGRVEIVVHFDYGIRLGVVHVIEGRCRPDDPWLNLLTDDGITDMNHGATFYECLEEVGKT